MGAKIYNSNLTKEVIDGAKLQVQDGNIPSEIAEKVIPVMEVNPKLLRRVNIVKQNTSGNIYTTPTDRDFYLTAFNLSAYSTAVGANQISISAIPYGETAGVVIGRICLFNTAAIDSQNGVLSQDFTVPIKLARGSAISLIAAGTTVRSATIFGYTTDQSNN